MSVPFFPFVFLLQKSWISNRKKPLFISLQMVVYGIPEFFFFPGGGGRGRQTLEGVRYSSCIDGLDSYCGSFLVFDKAHKAAVGESISLVSMVTQKILWNSKG